MARTRALPFSPSQQGGEGRPHSPGTGRRGGQSPGPGSRPFRRGGPIETPAWRAPIRASRHKPDQVAGGVCALPHAHGEKEKRSQGEESPTDLGSGIAFYIEKIVESMGYPSAAAKVYAYLVLRDTASTITEIARGTGLGKSTVAMNLKLLEHDGLVYSVKHGKQKLFYARSALPMVIMYPMKILKEYGEPLLRALERLKDTSERLAKLYREVSIFLNAYEKAMKVFEEEIRAQIGPDLYLLELAPGRDIAARRTRHRV